MIGTLSIAMLAATLLSQTQIRTDGEAATELIQIKAGFRPGNELRKRFDRSRRCIAT